MPIGLVDKDACLWAPCNCDFIIWSKWKNNPPTVQDIFFNIAQSVVVSDGELFSSTKEAASWQRLFFATGGVPKCLFAVQGHCHGCCVLEKKNITQNCNVCLPSVDNWPSRFNIRTSETYHLTFKSEEGWKSSRHGSISPEKRGILPSCFL